MRSERHTRALSAAPHASAARASSIEITITTQTCVVLRAFSNSANSDSPSRDAGELKHGIDVAREFAQQIATGAHGRSRLFIDYLLDLTIILHRTMEFFIACFSWARGDLGQRRAYADNGRGVASGSRLRSSRFMTNRLQGGFPISSDPFATSTRSAADMAHVSRRRPSAAQSHPSLVSDCNRDCVPWIIWRLVIASPLILNCVARIIRPFTRMGSALAIMGTPGSPSASCFDAVSRRSELVSYIPHPLPVAEIVVGRQRRSTPSGR